MEPLQQGIELLGATFGENLDLAAGQIADPAGHAQPASLATGAVTEADALDETTNNCLKLFEFQTH